MAAQPSHARPSYARGTPGHTTAAFYRSYGTTLFRYAWHLLGSREDAEDATQAAFLSAHSALEGGTTPLEPRAWLLRIVRNECLTRLGERSRRPATVEIASVAEPVAREPAVERQAELRSEVEDARRVLGRLPDHQREAFVLREWVGCSQQEVALALGVSIASVEGLLGRARTELVRGLDADEDRETCRGVRAQLADDAELSTLARGHLLRCSRCRAARRLLHPSRSGALARGYAVPSAIFERLAAQLPGFSAAAATAGGGGLAALGTKVASLPVIAKVAAGVAAAIVAGGTAVVVGERPGARGNAAAPISVASDSRGGASHVAQSHRSAAVAVAATAASTGSSRVSAVSHVRSATSSTVKRGGHAKVVRVHRHRSRVASGDHSGRQGAATGAGTGSRDHASHDDGSSDASGDSAPAAATSQQSHKHGDHHRGGGGSDSGSEPQDDSAGAVTSSDSESGASSSDGGDTSTGGSGDGGVGAEQPASTGDGSETSSGDDHGSGHSGSTP